MKDLHSVQEPISRNTVAAGDDAASSISFQSTFSSLYSGTTRSGSTRMGKLFNMKLEKETAKIKLMNGMKKEKRDEYKHFFLIFDQFLFDKPDLPDRLFSLAILYISALIHYERCILADSLSDSRQFVLSNLIVLPQWWWKCRKTDQTKQDVHNSNKDVIDRFTELSFCYSQILQRHTFRNESILTFRDTISEQLFYECLYKMISLITLNQFDNPRLQPIIESEIARLFRTRTFSLSKNEKKEMKIFIPSEKLYHLKQELGLKLPSKKFVRRKVSNAVNSRSPLITSMLPPFNKNSYIKDKGLDRGLDNIRLNIPPDVLLNLGTTYQEKIAERALVEDNSQQQQRRSSTYLDENSTKHHLPS